MIAPPPHTLPGMGPTGGAYTARRASALAGVPLSTIHHWAREGILTPSVSATRTKLWSYSDLLALRAIQWLRRPKAGPDGVDVPATTMPAVRHALTQLGELDLGLWNDDGAPSVAVRRDGSLIVLSEPGEDAVSRHRLLPTDRPDELLFPTAEFAAGGMAGPDLVAPRPSLRIVPRKLGGAPHIQGTRIETEVLAALERSGLALGLIGELYPVLTDDQLGDALALEHDLAVSSMPRAA